MPLIPPRANPPLPSALTRPRAIHCLWLCGWLFASMSFGAPLHAPRRYTALADGMPEQRVTAVASNPVDARQVLIGVDGFVLRSDDAGQSWRPILSFPRGLTVEAEAAGQDRVALRVGQGAGLEMSGGLGVGAGADLGVGLGAGGLSDGLDLVEGDPALELRGARGLDDEDDDLLESNRAAEATPYALPSGDADLVTIFPREEPGVRAILFVPTGADAPTAIYVATPRGLYRSVDGGDSFTSLEVPGGALVNDIRDVAIDPAWPQRIWLATAGGLLVSFDGGVRFQPVQGRLAHLAALSLHVEKSGAEDLVLVGTEGGLWRSWDGGLVFSELLLSGAAARDVVPVVAFDARSGTTYAGTGAGLYVAERDSPVLERRRAFGGDPVYSLAIDPARPGGVVVGVAERGVLHSDDAGLTLADPRDLLPARSPYVIARHPTDTDELLVGTERGVFRLGRGGRLEVTRDAHAALRRRWQGEPSLQEVATAALTYAQLVDPSMETSVSRARLSPLLPELQLSLRYARGRPDVDEYVVVVDQQDAFDETDAEELFNLAREGILVDSPTRGITWQIFALATWSLDDIVFNRAEVLAARQLPMLIDARRRLLREVQTVYSARRRLATELSTSPESNAPLLAQKLLRLEELSARLDSLTGGATGDSVRGPLERPPDGLP